MDFSLTEEQREFAALADEVLQRTATPARVAAVEAMPERFDRDLWSTLADAGLLGIAIPASHGGGGLGWLELCLLLEAQGRRVAPVPLLASLVTAALPLVRFGSPEQRDTWLPRLAQGEVVFTAGLGPSTATAARDGSDWRLSGRLSAVPWAHVATRIVVAARDPDHVDRLFLVDPEHTTRQLAEATSRELLTELTLQSSPAEPLEVNGSDEVRWLRQHALVGLCALQVGVCTEAVRLVSNYVSERRQFGRPLGSFQGVALRTADAYIDAEAIRVTMCQAAWRLASGLDAEREIYAAKWWAAEAGHRVVHAVQHLHGGIGADVEYPAHRYFLWGKHLATTLGGSSQQLALLGQRLAEDVRRGRPAFA